MLVEDLVNRSNLRKNVFEDARKKFGNSDWEYLLADVLQRLNPGWKVTRTGGKAEAKHGTDILMTIPDAFGVGYYGVAIQVKDYSGFVNGKPIEQILKAEKGYWQQENVEIIELAVVLVGGERQTNTELETSAKSAGVRLVWSSDVEKLMFRAACQFASDPDHQSAASEPSLEVVE